MTPRPCIPLSELKPQWLTVDRHVPDIRRAQQAAATQVPRISWCLMIWPIATIRRPCYSTKGPCVRKPSYRTLINADCRLLLN